MSKSEFEMEEASSRNDNNKHKFFNSELTEIKLL